MQRLRHARFLACLVLAWFALALGAAAASPVVKPQAGQLICSSSGALQLVLSAGQDGDIPSTHALDCPLCATVAPPPALAPALPVIAPLGHVLQPVPAARHAARLAVPPPARGPPQPS